MVVTEAKAISSGDQQVVEEEAIHMIMQCAAPPKKQFQESREKRK